MYSTNMRCTCLRRLSEFRTPKECVKSPRDCFSSRLADRKGDRKRNPEILPRSIFATAPANIEDCGSFGVIAPHRFKASNSWTGNFLMNRMVLLLFVLSTFLLVVQSDEGCRGFEFVSRKEWNARRPQGFKKVKLPVNHVIILHTVTQYCRTKSQCIRSMQFIQDLHMDDRGWWDIAYNFVVGGDGRVYEGRGWDRTGAHSINFNAKSLGIAFIGNYNKFTPTEDMINATINFISCGVEKGFLTPTREIHGHRDVACTESPGDNLYAIIRTWANYKGGRLPLFNCKRLDKPVILQDELDY